MADKTETILVFMIVFSLLGIITLLGYEDIIDQPKQKQKRINIPKPHYQSFANIPEANYNQQIAKCTNPDCNHNQQQKSRKTSKTESNTMVPLQYHSKLTLFVHNAIGMKWYGDKKGYGLFSTRNIKAGEILIIEYPLLKLQSAPDSDNTMSVVYEIHSQATNKRQTDPEFSNIWDSLAMNADILMQYSDPGVKYEDTHPMVFDVTKFSTNHFGQGFDGKPMAIYGLLSKINFGLPQNIAVIFGDKQDNFVCTILATRGIKKGEELVSDYFFDWFNYKDEKYHDVDYKRKLFRRSSIGALFDSVETIFRVMEGFEFGPKITRRKI